MGIINSIKFRDKMYKYSGSTNPDSQVYEILEKTWRTAIASPQRNGCCYKFAINKKIKKYTCIIIIIIIIAVIIIIVDSNYCRYYKIIITVVMIWLCALYVHNMYLYIYIFYVSEIAKFWYIDMVVALRWRWYFMLEGSPMCSVTKKWITLFWFHILWMK